MNKSIYAFAAAALLCISAAQAATQNAPQAATQNAAVTSDPSVQISEAKAHYKLFPEDFASYAGAYALGNGEVIKLKRMGRHFYTQVYGQDPVEIFALKSGVFASRDGTVVTFRDNNDTIIIDSPSGRQMASR